MTAYKKTGNHLQMAVTRCKNVCESLCYKHRYTYDDQLIYIFELEVFHPEVFVK